jgi:hypothetical protein
VHRLLLLRGEYINTPKLRNSTWGNAESPFNPNSGNVFLVDDDFRTFMLNDDDKLEEWVNCPNCGHEDFKSQVKIDVDNEGHCEVCVSTSDLAEIVKP